MIEEQNINQLPKDWKWQQFNEIATLIRGVSYDKQFVFNNPDEGLLPLMRATNIQKELVLEDFVYVPEKIVKKEQLIQEGDILVAMSSGSKELVGKAAQAKQNYEIAFGTFCGLIRPNDKINKKYFGYFFQTRSYRHYVSSISKGIGINNLRRNHIEDLDIPLPPKATQQAIVSKIEELFSELDKGIEQLKTAQQQLKTYRQSVLKWAFEGRLTSLNCDFFDSLNYDSYDLHDEHDFTVAEEREVDYKTKNNQGNQNNPINQSSDKGDLPKGWKRVVLGDVCTSVEYGSATKSKEQGKVPVLRMGNIQNGRFDWTDLVYTDDDEEIKKYLLKKDDVLFNRTNSAELVGKTAIYKGERPAIFAGYLIRINRMENLLDANFITYYLNTVEAKKYGNSVRSFGVNQSNINGTKLKSYPIPLPPLTEQHQIVQEIESRLSVADKMEESITQSLQQSEALRQSILKKAFEGKLV